MKNNITDCSFNNNKMSARRKTQMVRMKEKVKFNNFLPRFLIFHLWYNNCLKVINLLEKANLSERVGRKATGLSPDNMDTAAGLPKAKRHLLVAALSRTKKQIGRFLL
jgi:hypothetical protein